MTFTVDDNLRKYELAVVVWIAEDDGSHWVMVDEGIRARGETVIRTTGSKVDMLLVDGDCKGLCSCSSQRNFESQRLKFGWCGGRRSGSAVR